MLRPNALPMANRPFPQPMSNTTGAVRPNSVAQFSRPSSGIAFSAVCVHFSGGNIVPGNGTPNSRSTRDDGWLISVAYDFQTQRLRLRSTKFTLQSRQVASLFSVFAPDGATECSHGWNDTRQCRVSETRGGVYKWKRLLMQEVPRGALHSARGYIPAPLQGIPTAICLGVKLH